MYSDVGQKYLFLMKTNCFTIENKYAIILDMSKNPLTITDKRLTKSEKTLRLLRLRCEGVPIEDAATRVGLTTGAAKKHLNSVLSKLAQQSAQYALQYRALEAERLDDMLAAIYPKALSGDIQSITTVLAIGRERRKLLGLDVPVRVDVKSTHNIGVDTRINLKALDTVELLEYRRLLAKCEHDGNVIDA